MIIMIFLSSCGGPDALLINMVGEDGTVQRKLILTYHADEFDLSDCQVPVDTTWGISKSFDVSEEGDTTYSLTAIKEFDSVDEINQDYKNYKGTNPGMIRRAYFEKKFRWFNNLYRYSEKVSAAMVGIPPEDFFTEEEIDYFYMPDKLTDALLEGPDSTKISEEILDPLEKRKEEWLGKSLIRALVVKLADTAYANPEIGIDTNRLYRKEKELTSMLFFDDLEEEQIIDTLLGKGFYQDNSILVENFLSEIEKEFGPAFEADSYLLQTFMPGELIATNGYLDKEGNVLWEVDGDKFLSSDYEMWIESKTSNPWAWMVTGAFVLFVVSGLLFKAFKS